MNKWTLAGIVLLVLIVGDWMAGGLTHRVVFGTGILHLESAPAGAEVFVDGERVGTTPVTAEIRPGSVPVRFRHRFHPDALERVDIGRGEERRLSVALEPASGALFIVTNPVAADISLDGVALEAKTPHLVEPIATGEHEVTVTIFGRQTKTETVAVLPDQRAEASFELERIAMGSLTVQASPSSANVEVSPWDVPYAPGMELPIGVYDVRVEAPGYAPQARKVRVQIGRNLEEVRLERNFGRLDLDVAPAGARVTVAYRAGGDVRNEPYVERMRIPTGPVTVRASAMGYRNYERNLNIGTDGLTHSIRMQRFAVSAGSTFRDTLRSGGEGPLLVVVPQGRFVMGSSDGPPDERPAREVRVNQPFAIGVYETSHADMRRFEDWRGEDADPVTNLTFRDVENYLRWLSRETGYRYRLPSEAEWEYAARAGTTTRYFFGDDESDLCAYANVADQTLAQRYSKYTTTDCNDGHLDLAPIGSFAPNAFGLYDVIGNADEWVADCWHSSYAGAPSDARVWEDRCTSHIVRGGAFDSSPNEVTVTYRSMAPGANDSRGFRVVREL